MDTPKYTAKDVARFWSKVDRRDADQCWEWRGYRDVSGYGIVTITGKTQKAHRVAYEIGKKAIPPKLIICHSCDNRVCCNPSHLFLGTHMTNNHDKELKGRGNHPKGERNHKCKLTDKQVIEIRRLYKRGGVTSRQLGARYGVSKTQILSIVNRRQRV